MSRLGPKNRANDVLTFLVRSLPLKYFGLRLKSFASAIQRPGSRYATARAPNFALFAGVRDAGVP